MTQPDVNQNYDNEGPGKRPRMHFAPPKHVPPGLWRRVPPAIFPPLLGGLGLALDWRRAGSVFGITDAFPALLAGMGVAAALFAFLTYGVKLSRRPEVLSEELAILPGRAGVVAGVLCVYLLSALLTPFTPFVAKLVLLAGFTLHLALWAVLIPVLRQPGQGRVTPVWQITFVGPIVGAMAALGFGWTMLAQIIWFPAAAMAVFIWITSARQALAERVPAPLRPLLTIHLAPFALLGTVAAGLGWSDIATGFAVLSLIGVSLAVIRIRWLLEAGFSPLWGAMTFPLAASVGLWLTVSGLSGGWRILAGGGLVAATLLIPPVLFLIWRDWARGRLAVKTNAAIA